MTDPTPVTPRKRKRRRKVARDVNGRERTLLTAAPAAARSTRVEDPCHASAARPPRVGHDAVTGDWSDYEDIGTVLGLDALVEAAVDELTPTGVPNKGPTRTRIAHTMAGCPDLPERLRGLSGYAMVHHVGRSLERLVKARRLREVAPYPPARGRHAQTSVGYIRLWKSLS